MNPETHEGGVLVVLPTFDERESLATTVRGLHTSLSVSAPARLILREAATFGGVGTAAFVVQLASLNMLIHSGVEPLGANAIAVAVSCAVGYTGNRWLSFRHRRRGQVGREALAFLAVNAVTFAVGELILAAAYIGGAEHDHLIVNVLSVIGIGVGTVTRFWAYRRFVFTAPARAATPARRRLVPAR